MKVLLYKKKKDKKAGYKTTEVLVCWMSWEKVYGKILIEGVRKITNEMICKEECAFSTR